MSPAFSLLLIALAASGLYGQTDSKQTVTEFMGHKVILVEPKRDTNGFAEKSYQVCFDATTSMSHCYIPQDGWYGLWGFDPELVPLELGHSRSALFFSVWATAGGSGSSIHLALLRYDERDGTENMLPGIDVQLKEISGHAFWTEPSVSDAPILVTADFVWGASENHPEDHRYIISVYVFDPDADRYDLQDRYMTVRKYEGDVGFDKTEVLTLEKPEILAGLQRVKAERERQAKTPR